MRRGLGAAPHRAPAATPGGTPHGTGLKCPGYFGHPRELAERRGVPRRVQVAGHMAPAQVGLPSPPAQPVPDRQCRSAPGSVSSPAEPLLPG